MTNQKLESRKEIFDKLYLFFQLRHFNETLSILKEDPEFKITEAERKMFLLAITNQSDMLNDVLINAVLVELHIWNFDVGQALLEKCGKWAETAPNATMNYLINNTISFVISKNLKELSKETLLVLGTICENDPLNQFRKWFPYWIKQLQKAFPEVLTDEYVAELQSGVTL